MSPLEKAHVLFLEDEPLINLATAAILEEMGCEVTAALQLEEAWEAARSYLPDAAILDVNVGIRTSFELAEWLTARGVPVIFLTGYNYPAEAGRWRQHPRCRKPCKPEEIAALLTAVLRDRKDAPWNQW